MTNPAPQERNWEGESQFWMLKYFELKNHTDQVIQMLARGPALETIVGQLKSQAEAAQQAAAAEQVTTPPTPIRRKPPTKKRAPQ